MQDTSHSTKQEAMDAAKRLRLQRREFAHQVMSSEARIWLGEWKKRGDTIE